LGVDSVSAPPEVRQAAWARLDADVPRHLLQLATSVEPLGKVPELAGRILAGSVRGRIVIDVDDARG